MIRGTTALIAHIGYPTHAFKAPMIYNPYFERAGIDAVVVPMACEAEHYPAFLKAVFMLANIRGAISLYDVRAESAATLAGRLKMHYPVLEVRTGSNDPAGHDLVVNARPMGMSEGDPLPMDVARIAAATSVGEVVMKREMTVFLKAAQARGCRFQVGTDMLFEQIPAYLEFFGFASATPEALRAVAKLVY